MDEKRIRRIVQEELQNNVNRGVPRVPRHNHDGNNSPRVDSVNLVYNTKISIEDSYTSSDIITLTGIKNPSMIFLYGTVSQTGAGAIVNGQAQFGDCQAQSPSSGGLVTSLDIVQCCNVAYFSGSPAGLVTLETSSGVIAQVFNAVNTELMRATVTNFDDKSVTVNILILTGGLTFNANWMIV